MKWMTSLLVMGLLGGCSLTREVPPVQSYYLNGGAPVEAAAASCGGRVLRIALIDGPQWLSGTAIYYGTDDQKMYRYTRARWEQPPIEQLQQLTEKSIIESGLFGGVVSYRSLAKNDWLLELHFERMTQHIDAQGHGTTELMLYGVLIEQYSRHILGQKTFRYVKQSDAADVQSAVDGWSEGVGSFEPEFVRWLQQQCDAQPKVDRSDVDI